MGLATEERKIKLTRGDPKNGPNTKSPLKTIQLMNPPNMKTPDDLSCGSLAKWTGDRM